MKTYVDHLVLFLTIFCCLSFSSSAQMREVFHDANTADNDIRNLSFYSPSQGYVAFRDWIGYTSDSGRTFTRRYITISNVDFKNQPVNLTFGFYIKGVHAFNQNTLVAYGHYGWVPAILYSKNGGLTFELVYHALYEVNQFKTGITDMVFPQKGVIGYAVDADRILKTVNGGLSWSVIKTIPNVYFDFLEAVDNNNLIAFSKDYYSNQVLKTTDGGTTWQKLNLPAGRISYAYFLTTAKGWLSVTEDYYERFYNTNDGGLSWSQLNDTEASPFSCGKMRFVDANTGYALGSLYNVYKTIDGGKIWERLQRDNSFTHLGYSHNDIQMWDTNQLWTGGGQGFLELTSNGGGVPVPQAYFKIDTANLYQTGKVNLINYSRTDYEYKWYKNDTLISSSYSASYIHNEAVRLDSIKLVVTGNGQSDSIIKYVYFNPTVVINSFSPQIAGYGMTVTIKGKNFNMVSGVSFGGKPARSFKVVSPTEITAVVGNAESGNITVTTFYGSGTLPGFQFIPPLDSYRTVTINDSILCKSESVHITLPDAEPGVRYDLVDFDTQQTWGSVLSNGGKVVIFSKPIYKTGIYRIRATRLILNTSGFLLQKIFIKVEQTKSSFTADKVNINPGETVRYFPNSFEASTYSWNFDQDASVKNSIQNYPQGITYGSTGQKTLTLVSESINGCRDTARGNSIYVYEKPVTDDTCYISNLDSALVRGHVLSHLNKTADGGFLLTGQTRQSTILNSRYGAGKQFPWAKTSYVANYTNNGILHWTLYLKDGEGQFTNATTDDIGNIYVLGKVNSNKFLYLNQGDSMLLWAKPTDTTELGQKYNGFILKLDARGHYLWHTILYDHTPMFTSYPYTGALPENIKIKGEHIVVTGSNRAKLSYYKKGVGKMLFDLQNSSYGYDNQNNFAIKIDSSGNLLWGAGFFNAAVNHYSLSDLSLDAQGNSYYTGTYEGALDLLDADSLKAMSLKGKTGQFKGFLIQLNTQGQMGWYNDIQSSSQYGRAEMSAITTDALGNSFIVGRVSGVEVTVNQSNGTTSRDSIGGYAVLKFDPSGKKIWGVGVRSAYYGSGLAVQLLNGELYVAGTAMNNGIPTSNFLFTSSDSQFQNIQLHQSEFFMANYDTAGRLRRIIKSGTNQHGHVTPHNFFIDNNHNFFIGGNASLVNNGTDEDDVFGLDLKIPALGDGFFMRLNADYCYPANPPLANAGEDRTRCAGDTSLIGMLAEVGNAYYWTATSGSFNAFESQVSVQPDTTTDYYLTVVNKEGFVTKDTVRITVPEPPVAKAGEDKNVCVGATTTIGSAAIAGTLYQWSSQPAGFVSMDAMPEVAPTVTTTYYLIASLGTCIAKDTIVVSPINLVIPSVRIEANDTLICAGGTILFSAIPENNGSNPHYQWLVNGRPEGSGELSYKSSFESESEVRLILKTSAACAQPDSVASNMITVKINPIPVANAGADLSLCTGLPPVLLGSVAEAGIQYNWFPSVGLNNAVSAQPEALPSQTTKYILTATSSYGCESKDSVIVTVINSPATPIITQDGSRLFSSALIGNQWYLDGLPINGATTQVIQPALSGEYTVKVQANDCSSNLSDPYHYVEVQAGGLSANLVIGPNPVRDQLTIKVKGNGIRYEVAVFDLNGRPLLTTLFTDSYTIEMGTLTAGIYVIQVTDLVTAEQVKQLVTKL